MSKTASLIVHIVLVRGGGRSLWPAANDGVPVLRVSIRIDGIREERIEVVFDVHVVVGKSLGVLDSETHLAHKDGDLVKSPSQNLTNREHGKAVKRLIDEHAVVEANLLELGVAGPAADGDLPLVVLDVDEAGLAHLVLHLVVAGDLEGAVDLVAGLPEEVAPLLEDVALVVRHLGVLAARLEVDLGVLDPAARLHVAERLAVQLAPVVDAAVQVAHVDEVELVLLEGPVELGVVDLEAAVGRDPAGLHGGDVKAQDIGRGVLVGHIASNALERVDLGMGTRLRTWPRYRYRSQHREFSGTC